MIIVPGPLRIRTHQVACPEAGVPITIRNIRNIRNILNQVRRLKPSLLQFIDWSRLSNKASQPKIQCASGSSGHHELFKLVSQQIMWPLL